MNRLTHSHRRTCPVCFGQFTQPGRFGFRFCSAECAEIAKANREARRDPDKATTVSLPRGTATALAIGAGFGAIALAVILKINDELAAAAATGALAALRVMPDKPIVLAEYTDPQGRPWRLRIDAERIARQLTAKANSRGAPYAATSNRAATVTHTKRGFTVMELMAVVAIVALLLALALPALAGAREQARRARCGLQLRSAVEALTIQYEREGFPYVLPPEFQRYRCPSDPGGELPTYGTLRRGTASYKFHPEPGERVGFWSMLILSDREPWHDGGRNEARGDGSIEWRPWP